ncbi:MAG: flagellar basal body P-ring formation protein FlgA [Xanthobacteraceae bacterium]|nr:flagellar basal body P-ring formation protein FlgA [Xanthobacteraceae bacterium]
MTLRSTFAIAIVFAAAATPALAQSRQDTPMGPVLRASVTVSSDVVRIGDLVDNAGSASQIAIYRAPDLGTTGSLRVAQVLDTLRVHQVIGVDTHGLSEVSVTRSSRALSSKDIETQVAKALERRNGLGDAANLSITFERDLRDIQLDVSNTGDMRPTVIRYDSRSSRFDVLFEIQNDTGAPTRLRFTGTAVETVEAAVLARNAERGEVLRASDVTIERRPKAEVGPDVATRTRSVGMQLRRSVRAGQALKAGDLAKADLVTRDQSVTLVYDTPGLYLTGRGKALEGGTDGDTVSILNLQSKRTIQGVVIGPGQVSVAIAVPRSSTVTAALADPAPPASNPPEKAE